MIEKLYNQFQSKKIDDTAAVGEIAAAIRGRKLLLLAPGRSILTEYEAVSAFIEREKPYVIAVNFLDDRYPVDACFVSNHKRMDILGREIHPESHVRTILTSNIPEGEAQEYLYVDYDEYKNDDDMVADNAGLMLLKLLQRCGAQEAALAGFDGFWQKDNYYREDMDFRISEGEIRERQERIRHQMGELSRQMKIIFLTPSVYAQEEQHV